MHKWHIHLDIKELSLLVLNSNNYNGGLQMGAPNFIMLPITIFLGIWVLLCVASIINPRYMWTLTQSWKATKEPSPAYFLFMRIMSVIALLVMLSFFYPVWFH